MNSDIQVLSAGAVKTGIRIAADGFATGRGTVAIRFATAPTIRAEVTAGTPADVVIVPPRVMNEFADAGRIDPAARIPLGRVGAGVAVRSDAEAPDIASVDALKKALFAADTIAFNKASTGLYIESLFERLGIAATLADRIARQDNGAGVMHHLLDGHGRDIGFGAITEILVFRDRGVQLAGPLPAEIQNYTSYEAAPMRGASNLEAARAFVEYLAGAEGRELLADCGIEPV